MRYLLKKTQWIPIISLIISFTLTVEKMAMQYGGSSEDHLSKNKASRGSYLGLRISNNIKIS